MRLINTETGQLESFIGREIPHYAILSHTWTGEETTFQEFTNQTNITAQKSGFAKIVKTCELARQDGLKYAWVDTCCIDKTSSAELTEAINSMFQWYKNASVCYAYLSDFSPKGDEVMGDAGSTAPRMDGLVSCKWFTRGWTLQELIAPKTLRFYDETWNFRGTKETYADQIGLISSINLLVLRDRAYLPKLSVAEKMAWASGRQTTRVEDIAYCLLGIFDINMPLLYGEGDKAFLRLQQEIIKSNSDLSIFGWTRRSALMSPTFRNSAFTGPDCDEGCGHQDQYNHIFYGVLAPSLDYFTRAHTIYTLDSVEHTVTNRGVKIHCSLYEICLQGCEFGRCRCCSHCRSYVLSIGNAGSDSQLGIVLTKVGPDTFVRSHERLIGLNERSRTYTSLTRQRPIYILTETHRMPSSNPLYLTIRSPECFIRTAIPNDRWNSSKRCWYIEDDRYDWGMVSLTLSDTPWTTLSILFSGLQVAVIGSRASRIEIGMASHSGESMSGRDIDELFQLGQRGNKRLLIGGREVTGELSLTAEGHMSLVVKAQRAVLEDFSSSASEDSNNFPEIVGISSTESESGMVRDDSMVGSESYLPVSSPSYNPADSVQAVKVPCKGETRDNVRLLPLSIAAHHSVFSQTVPPLLGLLNIPLVIHRVSTEHTERADFENEIATYLNIHPDDGYAPAIWQGFIGTVIVARQDRKPLLPQHVEAVHQYCGLILDRFGDGEGAPTNLYSKQAFEKWWKESCISEESWADAKSPYED